MLFVSPACERRDISHRAEWEVFKCNNGTIGTNKINYATYRLSRELGRWQKHDPRLRDVHDNGVNLKGLFAASFRIP